MNPLYFCSLYDTHHGLNFRRYFDDEAQRDAFVKERKNPEIHAGPCGEPKCAICKDENFRKLH